MPPDEPSWWYDERRTGTAACLGPLASVYGWAARQRYGRGTPYRSRLPVICAGNWTAGGTGKTPLVIHLCEHLRAAGHHPIALTRGHGGDHRGPHWVRATDTAADVGDEALLLARAAPTLLCRDRAVGARVAEAGLHTSGVLVMDDGLQNPSLTKDLSIVVVNGSRGLGNGRVIPAGPLRAPLDFQLALTSVIIINGGGGDSGGLEEWLRERFAGPVLRAATVPEDETDWLRGTRVIAWAGIGSPERFFGLLRDLGAEVVQCVPFRDHQRLREADAERLLTAAGRHQAQLVTTAKDMARLAGATGRLDELASGSRVLKIKLRLADGDAGRLHALIKDVLARHAAAGKP